LNPFASINDGGPGFSQTGTWTTATGGFDGDNRFAETAKGKKNTATATWDFTSVPASTYSVYVTFVGQDKFSKKAPFTVYDGSTALGTFKLDESNLVTDTKGGLTQGSYGGVGWVLLGTFSISSGELQVSLVNGTNGKFVDADGALIVQSGAAAAQAGGLVDNTPIQIIAATSIVPPSDSYTTVPSIGTMPASANQARSISAALTIANSLAPVVSADSVSSIKTAQQIPAIDSLFALGESFAWMPKLLSNAATAIA
jgi:hypothetical protein